MNNRTKKTTTGPTALHDLRYAQATSNRERAAATYSRLLAAIKKLPRDADRDNAYSQLDQQLDAIHRSLTARDRT